MPRSGRFDYVVVAFPAGKTEFSGEMATELRALIESGTVRVLDLVVLTKDADGSVEATELRDADRSEVGQLVTSGRIPTQAIWAAAAADRGAKAQGGEVSIRPGQASRQDGR